MDTSPNFTKLRIWQLAHELTLQVYRISKVFPSHEQYALTSQIHRAAISVESNIAESHGRYHYQDSIKFLIDSRGSAHEVQTQLLIAKDLNYGNSNKIDNMVKQYTELVKQTNSLISYKRERKTKLT